MKYTYTPKGVCATKLDFDLEDGVVKNVRFIGGCDGNLKAIASLVEGMPAAEVSKKLRGVTCGRRPTSCTDQLSRALDTALEQKQK